MSILVVYATCRVQRTLNRLYDVEEKHPEGCPSPALFDEILVEDVALVVVVIVDLFFLGKHMEQFACDEVEHKRANVEDFGGAQLVSVEHIEEGVYSREMVVPLLVPLLGVQHLGLVRLWRTPHRIKCGAG